MEKVNRASGEAEAIVLKAKASAESIRHISEAIRERGEGAVSMMVAERYVDAFGKIAKEGTTILLPSQVGDPASMIASALAIYKQSSVPSRKDP